MARLPRLSGREEATVFRSLGREQPRQTGSHIILQGRQSRVDSVRRKQNNRSLDLQVFVPEARARLNR